MNIRSKNIIGKNNVFEGTLIIKQDAIIDIKAYDHFDGVDLDAQYIAPGLIDIHNHGYAGFAFTGVSSVQDISNLRKALLAQGVTSMLATISRHALPQIIESMTNESDPSLTEILGFHMEGPFINPKRYGAAHPDTAFPSPNIELLQDIITAAQGYLKVMTVAPEVENNDKVMSLLMENDIIIAVGHTNATYKQLMDHQDKINLVTHLGNAMSGLHHREIGTFGYGLLQDACWVELIADGTHVSDPMLEIIFKLKDPEKILLISDTIALAGMPVGEYDSPIGKVFINEKGECINIHNRHSGSTFSLLSNIRHLYQHHTLSLPTLFQMASLNPARFLGIEDRGEIRIDQKADLLVLDENLHIAKVIKNGIISHQSTDTPITNKNIHEHLKDKEFLNFYSV